MVEFSKESFPDSRCFIIYDKIYLRHRTGNHPEHPQRLIWIKKALDECDFDYRLDWVAPQKANVAEVMRIHEEKYIELVRTACEKAGEGYMRLDVDTVVCNESYDAALYAVGGLEEAIDFALGAGCASSFALVRPPGHHALTGHSMGFCLFNNIAIGALYAIEHHKIDRILIVDWDLHHGNGTQDVFWTDNRVFYISLHQAHHYPGTGFADEVGEGDGRGYTLNLPLPAGSGDSEYAHCFVELIGPVAVAFKPELILVSAGYDAHCDDPLGLMRVTTGEYGRLSYYLRCIARETGARLAYTLEGGYDLQALGDSVMETVRPLVLEDPDDSYMPTPFRVTDDVLELVNEQKERFSEFWDLGS
jgi:acetoin utilization deacetylase AcuC-like enzyme